MLYLRPHDHDKQQQRKPPGKMLKKNLWEEKKMKKDLKGYAIATAVYGIAGIVTSLLSAIYPTWIGITVMMWALFLAMLILHYAVLFKKRV